MLRDGRAAAGRQGHGCGAATACFAERAENIRRPATRGNSHDHIMAAHFLGGHRFRALRCGILGPFDSVGERAASAGDDRLHHGARHTKRRRTLGGVKNAKPAARAGANVEEPAAAPKSAHNGVHGAGDGR